MSEGLSKRRKGIDRAGREDNEVAMQRERGNAEGRQRDSRSNRKGKATERKRGDNWTGRSADSPMEWSGGSRQGVMSCRVQNEDDDKNEDDR